MKIKRYWLKGLIAGLIIYMFTILIGACFVFHPSDQIGFEFAEIAVTTMWPIVIIGFLIGYFHGKKKKIDVVQ
jgi:L-lactate permease